MRAHPSRLKHSEGEPLKPSIKTFVDVSVKRRIVQRTDTILILETDVYSASTRSLNLWFNWIYSVLGPEVTSSDLQWAPIGVSW